MELVKFDSINISVEKGDIHFDDFDRLREEATLLADNIQQVEVTEDNIKESKKLLAAVNKRVRQLEDTRISVKKQLLQPYNEFEIQVKDIVNKVAGANDTVRRQVRELEEQDREAKRIDIMNLFEKRIKSYSFRKNVLFADFLQKHHLNKTYSLDKVEQDMVDWLENIEHDLGTLNTITTDHDINEVYFIKCNRDIRLAMMFILPKEETEQPMEQEVPKIAYEYQVEAIGTFEAMRLEHFLSSNAFNYKSQIKHTKEGNQS